jgi:cysteine desulfuration protein SufE
MISSMSETFQQKIFKIQKIFLPLRTSEERYSALIEMGRSLPDYPSSLKTPNLLVKGCQSALYLHASFDKNQIFFQSSSDALISAGLAAILLAAYNGETPEIILTTPPNFLTELGISASLSPNRSNGLAQIHLRMKQLTLPFLMLS